MKKIFLIVLNLLLVWNCLADIPVTDPTEWDWWNYHSVISSDENSVIQASSISDGRIIQGWGLQITKNQNWSWVANVIASDSTNTEGATDDLLKYISAFINWALGMAFFVALAFLIYNWYLVVTAAWNDAQYKKWMSYIRYMAIALVWIGLSFFIIQFIFAIIFKVTK